MASSEKDKGDPLLHAHPLKFIDIHTRLPNLLVGETFSNRFKIYAVDYSCANIPPLIAGVQGRASSNMMIQWYSSSELDKAKETWLLTRHRTELTEPSNSMFDWLANLVVFIITWTRDIGPMHDCMLLCVFLMQHAGTYCWLQIWCTSACVSEKNRCEVCGLSHCKYAQHMQSCYWNSMEWAIMWALLSRIVSGVQYWKHTDQWPMASGLARIFTPLQAKAFQNPSPKKVCLFSTPLAMDLLLGIAVMLTLFGFLTGMCVSSITLASHKFYYS